MCITTFQDCSQSIRKDGNSSASTILSVADSKTNNRLTYLNKSDIEDVQFFMKLQKGDVIKNIVHVIVIENL